LAELIDDADAVFHLAASVGVRLIVESPVRTIENNVRGTEAVLEFAGKKKKKVLITSTSEVYGKSTKIPFCEDDDLVMGGAQKGRWSYACSKAIDEFLALAYWKERGLPVVIVRLFNTVGPRQTGRYGMVIPRFIEQAVAGEDLTVFGPGDQTRSFCDVRDTVAALDKVAEHATTPEPMVVNVGNDREISINELAALIVERAGSDSKLVHLPLLQAYGEDFEEIRRRRPALERLRTLTGFKHRFTLEQTIDDLIAIKRAPRAEAEHGDGALVRNQS